MELNVRQEDEITSTILGPLEFLNVSDHYQFWRHLLNEVGRIAFLLETTPQKIILELWPHRVAKDTSSKIEPDAIVHIIWPDNESRILLIEFKWHADLGSSDKCKRDQLHRQWLQYLTAEEREKALHLFIAPEISAGIQAIENEDAGGNVWLQGNRLIPISWLHIRSILEIFPNESSPLYRWAQLTNNFLEAIGIRKFAGFGYIQTSLLLPEYLPENIFWNQFSWNRFSNCPVVPSTLPNTIFFNLS